MLAKKVHAPTVVVSPRIESPGPREDEPDILPFAFPNKQRYSNYRRRLWERDNRCTYCHKPIQWKNSTLDHILPRSQGGLDTPSNLVLCCEGCNSVKAGRTLIQWTQDLLGACAATCQPIAMEGGVA